MVKLSKQIHTTSSGLTKSLISLISLAALAKLNKQFADELRGFKEFLSDSEIGTNNLFAVVTLLQKVD
jgi:hypothetical protein